MRQSTADIKVNTHDASDTNLLHSNHWQQINNPILNAMAALTTAESNPLLSDEADITHVISCPDTIFLPLHYRGHALQPSVNKGQKITPGQSLVHATTNGIDNSSLPGLVSPVHGIVVENNMELTFETNSRPVRCIAIKAATDIPARSSNIQAPSNKISNSSVSHTNPICTYAPVWASANRKERLQSLANYGVTGHGGGGFLLANKLHRDVDILIINAVECEPLISCDHALLYDNPIEVALGILALVCLTDCERCLIATEASDNHDPIQTEPLRQALAQLKDDTLDRRILSLIQRISFHTTGKQYPAGAERVLIKALTNQRIDGNNTPADYGMCCVNVATCHALYPVAYHDLPPTQRVVTICGDAVTKCTGKSSMNFKVVLGTPIKHILKTIGILDARSELESLPSLRVLQGGPLCGVELASIDVPVTQQTNCIVATETLAASATDNCIQCARCQDSCPVNLMPQELHRLIRNDDNEGATEIRLKDCLLCGYCDLVCPSHIPLTAQFRAARQQLQQANNSRLLAQQAEIRFEQRQLRIEKRLKERDERKARRQRKAHDTNTRKQAINDAMSRVRARKQKTNE